MRTITKGREPQSLKRHRNGGGTWSSYTQSDDARYALLEEQGHLCCFCMQRIVLRGMKVAHWASQADNQTETVTWDNLLGACKGGDGGPRDKQHCDTAQGKTPIKVHPADREQRCERFVRYLSDGTIESSEQDIQRDLDRTLNLNYEPLKKLRKCIYDVAISQMAKTERGYWSRADLLAAADKWRMRDKAGMLRPFCQVAIYRLEKKIQQRND